MLKRIKGLLALGLILSIILISAGCGTKQQVAAPASSDKPVVLNVVSIWPESQVFNDGIRFLDKDIKDRSKGNVQIKYLGGPEVIPSMELINSVKNGSVDIAWLPAAYTTSIVPEADAMKLSKFTPDQELKNGYYDLYNEIFQKKANVAYLGRGTPGLPFYLYTNVQVKTLSDFKGQLMRVVPTFKDFVLALGGSPVTLAMGDIYSALERGVVVGYGFPAVGVLDNGFQDKTKYVIDTEFYQNDVILLINNNKFNSLNDQQKKTLKDSVSSMETAMLKHFKDLSAQERQTLVSKGVQPIKLSTEDSKKYLELAYNSSWDTIMKSCPEYGAKLKDIFSK